MKGNQQGISSSEKILQTFVTTMSNHSQKTDEKIDKLVDSVQALTNAHIEHKADRDATTLRMERIEVTQKEQGKLMKTINDTIILLNERVENSKDKWKWVSGIFSVVVTAVLIGFFVK